MPRSLVGLALWFLPTIAAWGAEPSLPPTQQLLRVDDSGQWQLQIQATVCKFETRVRTVTKKVPETTIVKETVDGKTVEKTVTLYRDAVETQQYTVCVPDYQTVTKNIPAATLKAAEIDGRAIPLENLRARVGKETLVVTSPTDGKLPEAYASLFKPGTIVIALEPVLASKSPAPVATVAPPAAAATLTTPAVVTPLPQLTRSPAPQFVMLGRQGVDDVVVRRAMEFTAPITGLAVFKKGTVKEQAPVTMLQTVRQSESFTLAAKYLHFQVGDSRDVPYERIKERIARETAVVYSTDGDAIDPLWLQNLKSTTLVVVGPQLPSPGSSSGPAAPGMMPAPVGIPALTPAIPAPAVRPMPPAPPVPPKAPGVSTREPVRPTQLSAMEQELMDRANAEREQAQRTPLTGERLVTLAARRHAANMATSNTLAHELDGQGVGDRLANLGFGWVQCGENIARGQDTPAEAIASWMNSPGHRANLLGEKYTHIGVAFSETPQGQKYWTMVLAQAR
jgi:uncharacterized protein YkwD